MPANPGRLLFLLSVAGGALLATACTASEADPSPGSELPAIRGGSAGTQAGSAPPAGGSGGGAAGSPTLPPANQGTAGGGSQAPGGGPSAGGQGAADAGPKADAAAPALDAGDAGGEAGQDAGQHGRQDAGQDAGQDTEDAAARDRCQGVGQMRLDQTIVVGPGQTFDGECRRYVAGPALGDGSQDEGQKPMFRLEEGARLINVVLGAPAADGIHTYGSVHLANVVWEDIGEDALTIKERGTVELDGGSAVNGDDKVFQINAESTFRVSNFRADNAGKFIRQNGGTSFRVEVFIDRCDISNMDEAIFRTDSSSSRVTMTNTRYHNIGDELFMGVNPRNITQRGNQPY